MKRTTLRNALAVSVLAAVSGFASASPTFTFSEVAGFDSSKIPPGSVAAGVLYTDPLDAGPAPVVPMGVTLNSQMTWQDGVTDPRRSHLILNNPNAPGTSIPTGVPLTTPGAWVDITDLTHINNVIAQSFSWGPQDIWGRFVITDHEGGAAVVLDNSEAITITFVETLNQLVGGVCTGGNPFSPLAAPCPDYFTFTVAGLADLPFTANNGSHWAAQFQIDPDCNNCVVDGAQVYTREGTTSTLTVQARVVCIEQDVRLCDPVRVPEPSILTLIGLGLIGLGFTGWRRQRGSAV